MYSSRLTYYFHFLLLFSFVFLTNGAIACDAETDDQICFQESANSIFFSNPIDHSSNHKEYPEKEDNQELEEDNQEEIREKSTEENLTKTVIFSTNFLEVTHLQIALLQKVVWSILKSYNSTYQHNQAISSLYCVFRC